MNVKPSPTSPKAKLEASSSHLERLYRDDALKQFHRPPNRQGLSLATLVFSLLIGFLAGILGELVFNAFLLGDESPLTRLLLPNNTLSQVQQQKNRTAKTFGDVAAAVQPALLSIYPAQSGGTLLENAYAPENQRGTAMLLTNDGWAVTTRAALGATPFVAVTVDRRVYAAKKRLDDPASGLSFFRIDGNGYHETSFESDPPTQAETFLAIAGSTREQTRRYRQVVLESTDTPAGALEASDTLDRQGRLDAALPAAFVGGPIVNTRAKVVGILDSANDGVDRVWPIATLTTILDGVIRDGVVTRPKLGVHYVDVAAIPGIPEAERFRKNAGALITGSPEQAAILPASPAAGIGLQSGDLITKVGGVVLTEENSLNQLLMGYRPNDIINLTIIRTGEEKQVRVTLGISQQS